MALASNSPGTDQVRLGYPDESRRIAGRIDGMDGMDDPVHARTQLCYRGLRTSISNIGVGSPRIGQGKARTHLPPHAQSG